MSKSNPIRIHSISQFHQLRGLPMPEHPLISLVDVADFHHPEEEPETMIMDYYSISLKRNCGKIRYGQQQYDFDEGVMYFVAPHQLFAVQHEPDAPKATGKMLLIHPDFFWNTPLANTIHQYEFFGYQVNEALWLSENEEITILDIMQHIRREYTGNIDQFSKQIIISHIESLLNYSDRFYHRQFLTREKTNHQILERMEALLNSYFRNEELRVKGLPSVQQVA